MIRQVAPAALARARAEAADLQKLIDAQAAAAGAPSFALQPWDWSFYAQQVRKAHYDFDQARVAPYFELDHVLEDGVFYAAHELYGLTFKERRDLPVYQADVRVFEVLDADGKPLALFLADYFARDNKQGGAWMASYVTQSRLLHQRAVVANHLNIPKPEAGQPVLLTFDEVTALFHEFGHALHGMLSEVRYPMLSGTQVPRDFVEYPSQFNEMWAREPAVVAHYAHHYQSGEPMPPGAARAGDRRAEIQPGLCHHRIPRCGAARSGLAPDQRRRRRPPRQGLPPSKRRRCRRADSTTRRCRRAITRRTSRTSSRATTRPATTRICGARCWRAIPGSGSTSTAD